MIDVEAVDQSLYERVKNGPYFHIDANRGYLRLEGETRVDFLQRQTTNDLNLLTPERSLVTVLTSPTARIMDVMLLVDEGDAIGIVPLPGRKDSTLRFLRGRIFFMDRVTVTDVSDAHTLIELGGLGVDSLLQQIGGTATGGVGDVAAFGGGRVIRVAAPFVGDHLILAENSGSAPILDAFHKAEVTEITASLHEVLRIEMGIAGAHTELIEDYTPLEAGLDDAVADAKGCYTGQEVLARQRTYDKVVQRLVGLRLDQAVAPGAVLYAGDRRAGLVTSVVASPEFGQIGLGYVRRSEHEPGTILHTEPNGGVPATVSEIPFK